MHALVAVLIRPRETMRRILDAGRDRAVPLLVLGAIVAAFAHDLDIENVRQLDTSASYVGLFIAAALIAVALAFYLAFHAFAWLVTLVGRFFEGKGDFAAVRSALAWGLAPMVWSLLYRAPLAIWFASSEAIQTARVKAAEGTLRMDPGLLAHGCGLALVFGLLDLIVTVWTVVVGSSTLAEANGISTMRGFLVLAISLLTPVIVIVAAVLAALT